MTLPAHLKTHLAQLEELLNFRSDKGDFLPNYKFVVVLPRALIITGFVLFKLRQVAEPFPQRVCWKNRGGGRTSMEAKTGHHRWYHRIG